MRRLWRHGLLALATWGGTLLAWPAQAIDAGGNPRERIAAERAAARARYVERERACADRFAVTACVDDAKRERRLALSRLKSEQNELDDAARKARAAARSALVRERQSSERLSSEEKAAKASSATPETATPPRVRRAPRDPRAEERDGAGAPRSARPPRSPQASRRLPPKAAEPEEARLQRETRSRASFDAAQRAAEVRRIEVEQRNARRAGTRKPAAPLPDPAAATSVTPLPPPPPPQSSAPRPRSR